MARLIRVTFRYSFLQFYHLNHLPAYEFNGIKVAGISYLTQGNTKNIIIIGASAGVGLQTE